jgi:hypothetical protein
MRMEHSKLKILIFQLRPIHSMFEHQVKLLNWFSFSIIWFLIANETWIFRLWEHVYSDQVDINTTINSARTQTSIEIHLLKQQTRKIWPQLYSYDSTPITPQRDGQLNEYIDVSMIDRQQYDLSIKKIRTDFFESAQNFTSSIYIKQIRDCQIQFSETNFTAVFYSEYDE